MTTWKCVLCGTSLRVADNVTPKFCCSCGSTDIVPTERLATYQAYDNELEDITNKLNILYAQEKPLRDRYSYIMQYFRQQKARGLITAEEYNERAKKFKGKRRRDVK